ncbi:DUF1206 domain-containing protein [Microbacterium sp. C7(2022)]|uniref:DUF1206 domain-containing protein n=1 Tax=Microbacterium sp. C7(2022) TaxID=2992759 RepID=UPI00237A6778|nr:DUF1206 domain-containing protein [Microbacterium sp. C7(2022)]MDE0547193.1 DUF1206 domain-containing protein [Microbacterium sp. C7(2022)]
MTQSGNDAKELAREAQTSSALRGLARAGYVANGLVHLLIGAIVLVVAIGGDAESDQAGAFKAVAAVPAGFIALWALAVALWGLAAWQALEGILVRDRNMLKKWAQRISHGGQTVIYAALGVISAAVALGARPDGEATTETWSGRLLALPGGLFVLGALGLGIGIGGVSFAIVGTRRGFEKYVDLPQTRLGTAVRALGVIGYVAKGVALTVVGVLLVTAAFTVEPTIAGGFDGAIQALLALPAGPALAGIVGAGFVAYGVFCGFRARFARL